MIRYFIIALLFCSISFQAQDSLSAGIPLKSGKKGYPYQKLILPAGLITAGALLKIHSLQQNLQNNSQQMLHGNFRTKVDNYVQYAPAVFIFSGNSMGFRSKNTYLQMEKNTLLASTITGSIIFICKRSFRDLRPDNSARNSFPSGHSALSFTLAALQFSEYKDSNFWYAGSGFIFASATALMRVANNRHWCGDILTGAGLGIAVALIMDQWNPLSKLTFQSSDKKLSLIGYPVMGPNNNFGWCLSMNIR
jgi:membrane-associated phospholipid phosphatase